MHHSHHQRTLFCGWAPFQRQISSSALPLPQSVTVIVISPKRQPYVMPVRQIHKRKKFKTVYYLKKKSKLFLCRGGLNKVQCITHFCTDGLSEIFTIYTIKFTISKNNPQKYADVNYFRQNYLQCLRSSKSNNSPDSFSNGFFRYDYHLSYMSSSFQMPAEKIQMHVHFFQQISK